MTSTTITPIEIDGQFYVSVILDGHEKRYGPYPDTEAAETMAARFDGICRGVFHQQVAIGVVRQPAAGSQQSLIWRSANGRSRGPA